MNPAKITLRSMRALCALLIAVLFYGQAMAVSHAHGDLDHAPPHEVCEICLVATSDDDPDLSAPEDLSFDPQITFNIRQAAFTVESQTSPAFDVPENPKGPPGRPDRQSDASRAPPY